MLSGVLTHPGHSNALPRVLPFAVYVALMVLESAWSALVAVLPALEVVDTRWFYGARSAIALIVLVRLSDFYLELRPVMPAWPRQWAESVALGLVVCAIWIVVGPLVRMGAPEVAAVPPWPEGEIASLVWIGCRLFGAVLVVPVIEELFWRSYVMRRIDRTTFLTLHPAQASVLAVALSSALFALEHRELLAGAIAGWAYAWLYRRYGDLRQAIVAHAVTNLALGLYVLETGDYSLW